MYPGCFQFCFMTKCKITILEEPRLKLCIDLTVHCLNCYPHKTLLTSFLSFSELQINAGQFRISWIISIKDFLLSDLTKLICGLFSEMKFCSNPKVEIRSIPPLFL